MTDVISALAYALAAIEVVDSRVKDWDINIIDTVADNASSGWWYSATRPFHSPRSTPACAAW